MTLQEQAEIVQGRIENDVDEDTTPGAVNADRQAVREVPRTALRRRPLSREVGLPA